MTVSATEPEPPLKFTFRARLTVPRVRPPATKLPEAEVRVVVTLAVLRRLWRTFTAVAASGRTWAEAGWPNR